MAETTETDWPCQHGVSALYGMLHCVSVLPNGRYLATMGTYAFLPNCASTFDADDVTLTRKAECPSVARQREEKDDQHSGEARTVNRTPRKGVTHG